jgi:hypothetical protein
MRVRIEHWYSQTLRSTSGWCGTPRLEDVRQFGVVPLVVRHDHQGSYCRLIRLRR